MKQNRLNELFEEYINGRLADDRIIIRAEASTVAVIDVAGENIAGVNREIVRFQERVVGGMRYKIGYCRSLDKLVVGQQDGGRHEDSSV
jgi:hypothetical protein